VPDRELAAHLVGIESVDRSLRGESIDLPSVARAHEVVGAPRAPVCVVAQAGGAPSQAADTIGE